METSLHRELKTAYAGHNAQFEVPWGKYRVDVVCGDRLIEIQHGPLGAIRDKVRELLECHHVLVVKPIIVCKYLVKLASPGGEVLQRRRSPKRGRLLDIFDDLIHFTRVFPHRRLTLEVALVDIEEFRYPGHGRRRRWRRNDQQTEDQRLLAIHQTHRFRTAADLLRLIDPSPRNPFHTGDLAAALGIARWRAQRIAYCLHRMGAIRQVGKQGNARLYELRRPKRKSATPA
jgi:hypothetical protein